MRFLFDFIELEETAKEAGDVGGEYSRREVSGAGSSWLSRCDDEVFRVLNDNWDCRLGGLEAPRIHSRSIIAISSVFAKNVQHGKSTSFSE